MAATPMHRLHLTLMGLATALLLFLLVVSAVYAGNLLQFPFDYDQGEGFELVDTILFSRFEWPYQNTDAYPFYASNYPPLFHVMAAPFVWLFGPAYWYGRLLGYLATLVAAGALSYAVHRASGHRWVALLSGLAFVASNTVYHIAPLMRQHMTMVMFEVLAVVILAEAFPQRRRRRIALGLGLLIAAGYTKQLAAITAVAVFAWLFLRSPRRAVLWGLAFALVGGGIFLGLTVATEGEWWRQVIVANVNEFRPLQMFGLFRLWFELHAWLIVPAALLVLYELYFDRLSLFSVWFVVTTLLGGVGSGTWGAGDSYFATSIAAMCVLSGLFVARTLKGEWLFPQNYWLRLLPFDAAQRMPPRSFFLVLMPLLYLGYGVATFHMPTSGPVFGPLAAALNLEPNVRGDFYDSASYEVEGYANIGYLTTQADIEAGRQIVELIQQADGPVLSEEAGFMLAAGREVVTNPTQLLNLWRAGLWDGAELLSMIEGREFEFIILRAEFYPTPVLEAIGQHYQLEQIIRMNHFDYKLLRPINGG